MSAHDIIGQSGKTFQSDILDALQQGNFNCAKHAVLSLQDQIDEHQNIVSKTLVQAMYLLWIKSSKINCTDVRHKELAALRLIVTELVERHGANPTQGLLTAFHYCMQLGDVDLLKIFFSYGIDPCHLDSLQNSPLHLACTYSCHPDLVECILQHGGDTFNVCNTAGMTPLMIAIDKFWGCAAHGKDAWEKLYITIGILLDLNDIDLNVTDVNQRTAFSVQYERLHSILQEDVLDNVFNICEKMLKLGVDVNIGNSNGETAIHKIFQAAWLNDEYRFRFLKLLLDHPLTDLNATFIKEGQSCTLITQLFNVAVSIANEAQLIKYLVIMNQVILAGADIDAFVKQTDRDGRNILHICLAVPYQIKVLDIGNILVKNILKHHKSPAVFQAVNTRYQGKTPLEYLYPFIKPKPFFASSQQIIERFEDPFTLDIAFDLFRCGASKADITQTLQLSWLIRGCTYQYAKHVGLWYRAGVDLKCAQKLLTHILHQALDHNNMKVIDCFLREGFTGEVLHYAKFLDDANSTPIDTIAAYVNDFYSQPLSLQVYCATVLKNCLKPNAIYGVNLVQHEGRFLPACIKSIILNERLAEEINRQECLYFPALGFTVIH